MEKPLPPAELSAPVDPARQHELVLQHLPLVRSIAGKLYRLRWNQSVEFAEYCQMGTVGLIEAAQRYDPQRGAEFGTFASWRISGAILNGLVHSTEQHAQAAARRRLLDARVSDLSGISAQEDEHSVEASLARLAQVAVGLAVGFMLEGTGMYEDGASADRLDGYASIAMRQLRARVHVAVASLPAQERRVLESHYFQQQPFAEIAEDLGLTRGRISQVHKSALQRLRVLLAGEPTGFEA